MKIKLLFFLVLITICVTVVARRHKKNKHHKDNRIDSNITMHIDLNGELRKSFFLLSAERKPESNTLCSPLSALLPLAKLSLGAEGDSLDELLSAIGVSRKSKETKLLSIPWIHRAGAGPIALHGQEYKQCIGLATQIGDFFKPLLTRLRYLPGVKLDIASKLFVSDRAHLHRGFRDDAKEIFQSSVDKIDFTFPTYAAEEINSWVSSQTNGIIKDMLAPTDIPPLSSMVLVNAVYFNGRWKEPFTKVQNVTFHTPPSHKEIDMMSRVGDFNYTNSEALGSQIISIPYSGGSASLVVVCPLSPGGLSVLLGALRLSESVLSAVLGELRPARVNLTLPKFKLHDELDLELIYGKIGIKTIFNREKSGLTKIVRDETVHLTSAKHKCFIDVNEYGTEAAASSATVLAKLSLEKTIEFLVDHPFLYFILVNDQQLFSGTFINPESHN